MIKKEKCYKYDGYVISDKNIPYGIFVYRDTGAEAGYVPWDKVRLAEVIWRKRDKNWQFCKRLKRTPSGKGDSYTKIGIHIEIYGEVLQAMMMLYEEITGKKIQGADSVYPVITPLPIDVCFEKEEDELIDKLNFRG